MSGPCEYSKSGGKKLLVISPTPTHPNYAGSRARIQTLLLNLQQLGYEVHLLHIEREKGDAGAMREAWGEHYHVLPYSLKRESTIRRYRRRLLRRLGSDNGWRHDIDAIWDKTNEQAIRKLQDQHRFDIVVVEYVFFSRALQLFDDGVLKVLDTHDVFTDRHKLYQARGERPQWFSTSAKDEGRALDRADVVLAIQSSEADYFRSLSGTHVSIVGHTVDVETIPSREQAPRLLYIGSRNPINVRSLDWFISEIFPAVRDEQPNVELVVVGNIANDIAASPGVRKVGIIENLRDAYTLADIVVNPMLFGTGLKIKSLEAMAFGKALVTTGVGAAGLEDEIGDAYVCEDEPANQVREILRLLRDVDSLKATQRSAQAYVQAWNDDTLSNLRAALTEPRRE